MSYYDDAYMWAQEHTDTAFFSVASQDPVSFSSYEPCDTETNYNAYAVSVFDHEPKSVDHIDGDYGHGYGYGYGYGYDCDYGNNHHNWYMSANPTINYFEHSYMEPKLISSEPIECDTGYISYHTQYSISYSQVDSCFNEPEFEEYDPTPYGGGYDIISVYGKPLPPSDKTCYPHSKQKPGVPMTMPRPTPKFEPEPKSEPLPAPVVPVTMLTPMPVPVTVPVPLPMPMPVPITKPRPMPMPMPIATPEPEPHPLELKEVDNIKEERYNYPEYGYDYPWPEYEHTNATRVGYDYGYGKQVVQIPPSEYSPEVVDLCESIFGHWPCLARIRRQQMDINANYHGKPGPENRRFNPWDDCASYFFGRPTTSYNV